MGRVMSEESYKKPREKVKVDPEVGRDSLETMHEADSTNTENITEHVDAEKSAKTGSGDHAKAENKDS